MEPINYPFWMAVSTWLELPYDIRNMLEPRQVFVGGAIKVFETAAEAEKERRIVIEEAMKEYM